MKLKSLNSSANEPPHIVLTYGTTPSPEAARTLAVLRLAVAEALDRKRRLGQYAVFWEGGQVVEVGPQDLPALP